MGETLYDRLGGSDAIEGVVAEFYRLVMADRLLTPIFARADRTRLAGMLSAFLASAFGGPDSYTGRDLRTAHAHLDITDAHFDAVLAVLGQALKDAKVSDVDAAAAAAVAETARPAVLGR